MSRLEAERTAESHGDRAAPAAPVPRRRFGGRGCAGDTRKSVHCIGRYNPGVLCVGGRRPMCGESRIHALIVQVRASNQNTAPLSPALTTSADQHSAALACWSRTPTASAAHSHALRHIRCISACRSWPVAAASPSAACVPRAAATAAPSLSGRRAALASPCPAPAARGAPSPSDSL